MIVAASVFVVAGLVTAGLARAAAPVFAAPSLTRRNYRDHELPTAVGVLIPLGAAVVVAAVEVVLDPWRASSEPGRLGLAAIHSQAGALLAMSFGFALLGLLDDLAGEGQSGGFRGHLGALAEGRLTTGSVKLLGGPVVALAAVGGTGLADGRVALVRDAAIVALAANLANLFDRAPGRVIKVGILWFALVAVVTADDRLAPTATVVGASVGLLPGDLRERFMIGDAGANALGAALGFGLLVGLDAEWRWVALGVLAAANLASEVVSFGEVIDRVPPLRRLDRLGSPHRR